MKKISSFSLKKDTKYYSYLKRKNFTLSVHEKKCRLKHRAYQNILDFDNDRLSIEPKDVKTWINYIMEFEAANNQRLQKLQKYVDFNVFDYADGKLNWQYKLTTYLFGDPDIPNYLSSKKMKSRWIRYINLCKKLKESSYDYIANKRYHCIKAMREDASDYAKCVLAGKIKLEPADYEAFKNYINIICYPIMDGSVEDQAIKKVETLKENKKQKNTSQTTSLTQKTAVQDAVIAEEMTQQQPTDKEKHTVIKHNKSAEDRKKTSNPFKKLWGNVSTKAKITVLSAAVFVGGLWGIKSCNNAPSQDKVPLAAVTLTNGNDTTETKKDTFSFVTATKEASKKTEIKESETKKTDIKAPVAKQAESQDSIATIWKNYYDNTVEILSSNSKKEQLYHTIETQIEKGIFTLPENVSKEKFAYTYLIYKAYGLRSSLEKALNSEEKLSPSEMKQITQDIKDAGDKGQGAKKKAAKLNNGRLNNHSKYNSAPHHAKVKHTLTLKQLRKTYGHTR